MKLVLKVRHTPYYFSANTETGLTKSANKATNVNIGHVLSNRPELLDYMEFYVIERRGATPTPLVGLKKLSDNKVPQIPQVDIDPHSDDMLFVLSRKPGDTVYENFTSGNSKEYRQDIVKDVQIDQNGEYRSGVMVSLVGYPEPIDAGYISAEPK
jgi:hypothetical protein